MLDKEKRLHSRLEFVRFWARYVKETPNHIWSTQQTMLINAVLQTANQNVEDYLRVKQKIDHRRAAKSKIERR